MTYEQYKDSGIDWIGQIPAHWEVCKNKFINKIYNGDSLNENQKKKYESEDINELPYISSKDINLDYSTINYENGLRISDSQNFKIAPISTSLICIEGGSAGRKIAFTLQNVCFVNKLACFNTYENYHSKFIYYSLKGQLFQTQFKNAMTGLIGGVSISALNNFIFTLPPIHEQEGIANFLDDKTAKIDALVKTKEQQIEKLKELRQAKIHHAVTKGLPLGFDSAQPTYGVEMKDSGIEWIGEIPKHWEVRRLSTLGKFSKGGGFSKADLVEEYGVSAILYGDIYTKYNYIINESVRLISNIAASNAIVIEYDDLLFTGSGETKEDIGKCVAFKSKTLTVAGGDIIIFKQFTNSSNYLSYCLNTEGAKFEKAKSSKGEIIVHTYASKLKEIVVPIPPIQEQEQIVAYLDEVTAKIDQAIAQKQEQITKLKEYKQSLINEVVTGKVKVCG